MNRHLKNSRFAVSLIAMAAASCFVHAEDHDKTGGPTATSKDAPRLPVAYIVKEKSLIGNEMHEAGARVMYDGHPADNLEPTDEEGRRRAAEFKETDKERVKKMVDANKESGVGDPAAFAAAFAKELAAQKAESDAKFNALLEHNAQTNALLAELIGKMSAPAAAQAAAEPVAAIPTESTGTAMGDALTKSADDTGTPAKRTRGG